MSLREEFTWEVPSRPIEECAQQTALSNLEVYGMGEPCVRLP